MAAPPSEVDITPELVAALIDAQHPHLAGDVRLLAHGWDNDIYRVGKHLAARLPRRAQAVRLVANEQRWLPELAPHLPVKVPAAIAAGAPGGGYPWPWSILPWFEGRPADQVSPVERRVFAEQLADALLSLHHPAPPDAPVNSYRGVPLSDRDFRVRAQAEVLRDETRAAALRLWDVACTAPPNELRRWVHGELHPGNVILDVAAGITALIDFGDMSGGDPAVDLAAAWLFFEADGRAVFRSHLDQVRAGEAVWLRARGWALAFALGLLHESDGSDRMTGIGRLGLQQLLADSCD